MKGTLIYIHSFSLGLVGEGVLIYWPTMNPSQSVYCHHNTHCQIIQENPWECLRQGISPCPFFKSSSMADWTKELPLLMAALERRLEYRIQVYLSFTNIKCPGRSIQSRGYYFQSIQYSNQFSNLQNILA